MNERREPQIKIHLPTGAGPVALLLSLAACSTASGTEAPDGSGSSDGESAADAAGIVDGPEGTGTADGGNTAESGLPRDAGSEDAVSPGSLLAVNLGTAGNYVILAKSGISTVPTSAVTGNLGISPSAASYITGFSLTAYSTNVYSTSPQVIGDVYASNYAAPTPSNLTTAVADMMLAFTDAAGRAANVTELGAGNIGGMTLTPGVYKWSSGLLIPTSITLAGAATDVWIFEIAQGLTVSNATNVVLSGGAVPSNVFWQVSGDVSLGTTVQFAGVILGKTAIALGTGASVKGRLLAQTAVSIESSTVTAP
jgi:hypothetical protein